jgi:hypothetical protein
LEHWAEGWHQQTADVHALGCYLVDNLRVVANGFLFMNNAPVYQADVVVPYIKEMIPKMDDPTLLLPDLLIDEPTAVIFDRGYKTYGHVLLDTLLRLLVLEMTLGPEAAACRILLPSDIPSWAVEMMKTAFPGLTPRFIFVDLKRSNARIARAVIPTHAHNHYRFHPLARSLFLELAARCRGPVPDGSNGRLWLSRLGLARNHRTLEGAAEAEEFARLRGMCVIHPETMSWVEQVRLFASACLIAGEYGSALHNAAFAQHGVTTLSLGRLQFLQSFLGALNGQRLAYFMPDAVEMRNGRLWARFDPKRTRDAIDRIIAIAEGD